MTQDKGLYGKFGVFRFDGRDAEGNDRGEARYFVLDYIYDPYARQALEDYANYCQYEYPILAADLLRELNETKGVKSD